MQRLVSSCARQAAAAGLWQPMLRRQLPGRLASALSPPPGQAGQASYVLATSPVATQFLAFCLAADVEPGDCYLLFGSVGAGKSFFSRTFIRAVSGDEQLAVPSPTFLLQNIYDEHRGPPVHHFDLYRLEDPRGLQRLDLPASFSQAVSLVEWPERLGDEAPPAHLQLHIRTLSQLEQQEIERRHGSLRAAGSNDEGDEDDAWEYDGDDLRWRLIALQARGPRWQQRLQQLEEQVRLRGAEYGCWLSPDPALANDWGP